MSELLGVELEGAWELARAGWPFAKEAGKKIFEGFEKGVGSKLAEKLLEKITGADPEAAKQLEKAAGDDDREGFLAALAVIAEQQKGLVAEIRTIVQEARDQGVLVQQAGAQSIGVVQGDVHYHGSPAAAAPARKRVVGAEPGTPDFVGREKEIEQLEGYLRGGEATVISAIGGMGGIGKTALALHVAERVRDQFDDVVLVDLRGFSKDQQPMPWQDAMRDIVLRLAPGSRVPEDDEQLRTAYHSVLDGRRALVIADNVRRGEQAAPLQPHSPSALVVTSRTTIALEGVRRIDLDALSPNEADELLVKALDQRNVEEGLRERIATLCARLPLALRAAGSYLGRRRARRVEDYIVALEERTKELADEKVDVPASLGLSAEALEQDDAALAEEWRMLGVFPGDFDVEAAAAVWELEIEPARDEVDELLGWNLLQFDPDSGRLALHDLMRELTGEAADAVLARHAKYFAGLAARADEEFEEGDEGVLRGLKRFDHERHNIESGQRWAAGRTDVDDEAARLAVFFTNRSPYLLDLRLPPRERTGWLEASVRGARRIGDRRGEGYALGSLGNAYADLGETRRAIELYEQWLTIGRGIGDRRGEGSALGNLGLAYADLGETRRAIELYEQWLTIGREIGDRRGEGNALGSLGVAYKNSGETRRAIELYEQQLVIVREIGDRRGEGAALGNLGVGYENLGETRRAIELYEQQLVIVREIGDRRGEGNALHNLAGALDREGRSEEGIEAAERAVAIFKQIEAPSLKQARALLRELRRE